MNVEVTQTDYDSARADVIALLINQVIEEKAQKNAIMRKATELQQELEGGSEVEYDAIHMDDEGNMTGVLVGGGENDNGDGSEHQHQSER